MDATTQQRILSHVASHGRIPGDCTWKHLAEIGHQVECLGWPRFQLTDAGREAIERTGREALLPRPESPEVA